MPKVSVLSGKEKPKPMRLSMSSCADLVNNPLCKWRQASVTACFTGQLVDQVIANLARVAPYMFKLNGCMVLGLNKEG